MKNKTIIIAIAALLACTAFTGCGKTESTTETEKQTEVSVVEESQTVESTETTEVKEPEVEDNTYCKLMSDTNFDMDNAVRDDWKSDLIQADSLLSKNGYEVLFNYVDGAKYAEITGATVTEVNKTVEDIPGAKFYTNIAYYGIDPNPQACDAINMFALIETSLQDTGEDIISEITILKAYTIPEDNNPNYSRPVIASHYDEVLCEIEYNGRTGYAILKDIYVD